MLIAALAGLAVIGPGPSLSANNQTRVVTPIKIAVVAREWSFKFSKASVKAGSTVIFTVTNKGSQDHNLVFTTLGKHTALLGPGKSAKLKVVFKKKGRYPYICSLPRHAERGMADSFLVKPK
jgi:uncharacterized cupredoxin-like copper-binding protein